MMGIKKGEKGLFSSVALFWAFQIAHRTKVINSIDFIKQVGTLFIFSALYKY